MKIKSITLWYVEGDRSTFESYTVGVDGLKKIDNTDAERFVLWYSDADSPKIRIAVINFQRYHKVEMEYEA